MPPMTSEPGKRQDPYDTHTGATGNDEPEESEDLEDDDEYDDDEEEEEEEEDEDEIESDGEELGG